MKKIIVVVLFLFFCLEITAQVIQGQVIDNETSEPIENSKVLVVDSEVFVFTDKNGSFEIPISDYPVALEVSAMGYKSIRYAVVPNGNYTIRLRTTSEKLSEVLINGALISNSLQRTPAAVSVLNRSELQKKDISNFAQVFNGVPGVYVNQGALNTTKLNIRGIGARSQFSTNRIQAYFNGIPLTTGEGELTIDDFDAETISNIEIIKGPTSSIFGAGLGGVINMYAQVPDAEETKIGLATQTGSYNTLKNTFTASHAAKSVSLFTNYSDLESDGYRDNGSYKRRSGLINATFYTNSKNRFFVLGNFTNLKAFIPSSLNEEDYLNSPRKAAFTWGRSKGFESYDRGLLGVSYLHHFSGRLTNLSSVFLNFRDGYEPRPFNILNEKREALGGRTKFNLDLSIFNINSELSFGAEYCKERYHMQTFENLYRDFEDQGSVKGDLLSENEQDRDYANFFGQLNLELSKSLILETGFNVNTTKFKLEDQFVQNEIDQSGNYRFSTIFSPRIGASYVMSKGKNLYASISHGFSTPTVEETLTPNGQINTDLKVETGINYEVGFKGNWLNNTLYTEVALYTIQIDDLLVAQRISEDEFVGINAGKTNHNGAEITMRYLLTVSPNLNFKPFLNASLNNFKFQNFIDREIDYSENRIPGVPKSTVNTGFEVEYERNFSFFTNLLAVGEILLNDANTLSTENYQVMDIKARYEFKFLQNFEANISAGINNVLDEKYASSVLPNAVGFGGAAPRYYYPGNPRNNFVGFGLNYIF